MEIIEELEPLRRSLFYGSCGYLDQRGDLDLNILIRTLLLVPTTSGIAQVYGQVGAGIVADSDPDREWAESLQKAKAQIQALAIAEDQ
jgi:para-aminobenzoate synthetase component 1